MHSVLDRSPSKPHLLLITTQTLTAMVFSSSPTWEFSLQGTQPGWTYGQSLLSQRPTSPHPPPAIAGRNMTHRGKRTGIMSPATWGQPAGLWLKDLPGLQNKPVCCVLASRDTGGHWGWPFLPSPTDSLHTCLQSHALPRPQFPVNAPSCWARLLNRKNYFLFFLLHHECINIYSF